MRVALISLAFWSALAAPSTALEQITTENFLARVTGRTATFIDYNNRELVGVEQFLSASRSVWARADGTCAFGTIYTKDSQVCFVYDDDPLGTTHCWFPFADDKGLWVVSADTGGVQEVSEITDKPVNCTPVPTS